MDSCSESGGGGGPGGHEYLSHQHASSRRPGGSVDHRGSVAGASRQHGGAAHGCTDGGFGVCEGAERSWTPQQAATAVQPGEHQQRRSRPLVPAFRALQRPQERRCGASWVTFAVLSRRNAPPYPPYGSTENAARRSLRSPGSPKTSIRRPSHTISRSRRDATIYSSRLERACIL